MTDKKQELKIKAIENGTVIDHITANKSLHLLKILNLPNEESTNITIAMNVSSKQIGRKDILKIENRELAHEEVVEEKPEEVVEIKNIAEIEAEPTKDTMSSTIPFVVAAEDEEVVDEDEEDGSNTVLNVILIVLIVVLVAVLGLIVFYILKTIDQLVENSIDEVRHPENNSVETPVYEEPIDNTQVWTPIQEEVLDADKVDETKINDEEFSNTVSMEISKIMDEVATAPVQEEVKPEVVEEVKTPEPVEEEITETIELSEEVVEEKPEEVVEIKNIAEIEADKVEVYINGEKLTIS